MSVKAYVLQAAALLLCFGPAGCATATGGMAISDVPISGRPYEVVAQSETTVHWWSLNLGLYSGPFQPPRLDAAMEELRSRHSGQALVNIRYSLDQFLFPLCALHRLHMKADVVRFGSPTDEAKR